MMGRMIGPKIHDLATAIIRTVVPFVVSWLVVVFGVDPASSEAFLTMLFGAGYYTVVRIIAEWVPQAGWLLGVNKAPTYPSGE